MLAHLSGLADRRRLGARSPAKRSADQESAILRFAKRS
ncbi:hypothetical protein CSC17_0050 [Klebsiella oxytoca]|nr:hypothetical protein CSC17_0050 [Klebsiella oxytoca]